MLEQMTQLKPTMAIPEQLKEYQWYNYRQNNSGGHFIINDDVAVQVLIQATSDREANLKARDIGIYFDGVELGMDCNCCGDRWHEAWGPVEKFASYNWRNSEITTYDNVRDYAKAMADEDVWAEKGKPSVIVYYANNFVERFFHIKKGN